MFTHCGGNLPSARDTINEIAFFFLPQNLASYLWVLVLFFFQQEMPIILTRKDIS